MTDEWSQYKKVKLRFFCLFALSVPIAHLVNEVGRYSFLLSIPLWFFWVFFAVGLAYFKLGQWPCPRCKKPFHFIMGYGNILKRSCFHCGLKLYQKSFAEVHNG